MRHLLLAFSFLLAGCAEADPPVQEKVEPAENQRVKACKFLTRDLGVNPRSNEITEIYEKGSTVVVTYYAANQFGAEERHLLTCHFESLTGLTLEVMSLDSRFYSDDAVKSFARVLLREGF